MKKTRSSTKKKSRTPKSEKSKRRSSDNHNSELVDDSDLLAVDDSDLLAVDDSDLLAVDDSDLLADDDSEAIEAEQAVSESEDFIDLDEPASASSSSSAASSARKAVRLHTTFEVTHKLEALYTGGPVDSCSTADQRGRVVCVCEATVHLLDVASGQIVKAMDCGATVLAVATEKRNCAIMAVATHGELQLWDLTLPTSRPQRSWKVSHPVVALCFDASGGLLAAGNSAGVVSVWDVRGGFGTHSLRGHAGIVASLLFPRQSGSLELYSGGEDGTVRVWDLVTSTCRHVLDEHLSVVTGLAQGFVDPDRLVSVGRDKVVNVWNLKFGKLMHTIPVFEQLESVCLFPSKQHDYIVTGSANGRVHIWDSASSRCVLSSSETSTPSSSSSSKDNNNKDDDDDDRQEAVTRLFMWGERTAPELLVAKGSNLCTLSLKTLQQKSLLVGHADQVLDIRFLSASGQHIAVATNDHRLRVFDTGAFSSSREYAVHRDNLMCLAVSPSFQLLASGSRDHTVQLWTVAPDTAELQPLCSCEGHTDTVTALAFLRKKSNWLVSTGADLAIKTWIVELSTGADGQPRATARCDRTAHGHSKDVNALCVAPNDMLLASGSHDRTVRLWSLPDMACVAQLKGHKRAVWSVAFSPVDQVLASSSGDLTIRLWSLQDHACIRTFQGHGNSILRVFFLSNGLQLLSSGSDGLLKLWTVKTAECTATFDAHNEKVWALDVRPDEMQFASGGADSRINVWANRTEQQLAIEKEKNEERIAQEQLLSNCLLRKQYTKAIQLALQLEKPRQTLRALQALFDSEEDAAPFLNSIIVSLSPNELYLLLRYTASWNTHAKHAVITQQIINCTFTLHTPESLMAIVGKTQLFQILEALGPYTQRHFQRTNALLQKSYLIDLMLKEMDLWFS